MDTNESNGKSKIVVELTGKDRKKIFEYLEENRELLINYYRQVVEHKLLDKISIEIIK